MIRNCITFDFKYIPSHIEKVIYLSVDCWVYHFSPGFGFFIFYYLFIYLLLIYLLIYLFTYLFIYLFIFCLFFFYFLCFFLSFYVFISTQEQEQL